MKRTHSPKRIAASLRITSDAQPARRPFHLLSLLERYRRCITLLCISTRGIVIFFTVRCDVDEICLRFRFIRLLYGRFGHRGGLCRMVRRKKSVPRNYSKCNTTNQGHIRKRVMLSQSFFYGLKPSLFEAVILYKSAILCKDGFF